MSTSKTRLDKWLWAVRIYKTRSLAKKACESGKVKIGGEAQKPSRMIFLEEEIGVRINHRNRVFKVKKLIEKRVGASIAVTCYEDLSPPDETDMKIRSAFYHVEKRERGSGRPTKKERRDIDKHKSSD